MRWPLDTPRMLDGATRLLMLSKRTTTNDDSFAMVPTLNTFVVLFVNACSLSFCLLFAVLFALRRSQNETTLTDSIAQRHTLAAGRMLSNFVAFVTRANVQLAGLSRIERKREREDRESENRLLRLIAV